MICGGASWSGFPPLVSYAVLIVGRLLLGLGESLAVVGLMGWCFGVVGPQRSGLVFSLVGMALYGAFAVGSPIGVGLYDMAGFAGVMAASTLAPIVAMMMVLPIPAVPVHAGERPSFWSILKRIWQPGVVVALQGVGSATIGAFVVLLFLHRGWPHAGYGLACFGGAFVLVRVLFGHLPDRIGSIPVAVACMVIEAAGQFLLSAATGPAMALAGAAMTGLGCSLLFPSMGIEVVRRVPAHLRATAAGGLAAFQDLALGATGPVTGVLADRFGYGVIFVIGGASATLGLALVIAIRRGRHRQAA